MLLLHLSDIHFRSSDVGSAQDPNFALRNELLRDCEAMCRQVGGSPDAVIVSGDIAYAGKKAEYDFATKWLDALTTACGASLREVFVCPGNHDVDRAIAGRQINQILHRAIKDTPDVGQMAFIQGLLQDDGPSRFLYEPLDAYNLFAGQFLCDLKAPERTRAVRNLKLNDGSTLRLWALNTAFVSSAADKRGDLFVDNAALNLPREAGVENVAVFHHPAGWLRNGQDLTDHLNSVARLQLSGHEHLGRVEQNLRSLKLRASAAHPDRHEPNWAPGYNLIELHVEGAGDDRLLRVKVHARIWNPATQRFQVSQSDVGGLVWEQTIALEAWRPTQPQETDDVQVPLGEPEDNVSDAAMTNIREIGIQFYSLSFSKKNEIAGRLGLLEDDDLNQPDFERFRRVFLRAHERGQLPALEAAIRDASNPNQTQVI
jgi:hypothetical protein